MQVSFEHFPSKKAAIQALNYIVHSEQQKMNVLVKIAITDL